MNIKELKTRTSVRDYKDKKMSQKDMDTLIEVINNSPTSTNAQQFSAILITEQKAKDFISKGNWGQKHISKAAGLLVFVGDRTRNNHFLKNEIKDEGILFQNFQRAMVDASIASAYAQDALITMGYGVAYIGGLPSFGKELEKFLKLPKDAFVVVGLSFGKIASKNEFKIKVNKVFKEKYNKAQTISEVKQYDKDIVEYYASRGMKRSFEVQNKREVDAKTTYGKSFSSTGKYYKNVIKTFKK